MPTIVAGTTPGPMSACLARILLAELLIAKKQPKAAKQELDVLLAGWAKPDRATVAAVDRARALRASLR